MTKNFRNTLLLGACYCSTTFTKATAFSTTSYTSASQRKRPNTALHRNSPGFVGFNGPDSTNRGNGNNGGYSWQEPSGNPYYDMRGQVAPAGSSNLANRRDSSASSSSSRSYNSVAEEQQQFDYSSRYSQMPHEMMPPHIMQQQRGGFDGRIQGGSRQTYQDMGRGGQAFVETDGRPLHVEMEMWDGPNNTPSSVKFYSEDGRQRPMNVNTNYNGYGGGRGGTMSVRNVGSMEFPMRAGVGPGGGGRSDMMGGNYGPMGMSSPYDTTPIPSAARGITVQGGSLKTFKLPSHINAAQVTIKSDGLPVNAKVELWGSSSHVKQVAEVYNDNGQTRPFAAIIDVPGEENTIAVRNTGPLEYPIEVVVEPAGMGMNIGMGRGGMMDGGYGGYADERMMLGDGFEPMMRGLPPPPPMRGGPPFMLPPPPPF
mmetsp:Transcript_21656/g.35718  ORF Transcript_21656/g.35718 Transcript_21656/m.35718 type:complete len:426 (+) Transcript_21656:125-1402(+)